MEAAVPVSAWHPPSAPATVAWVAMSIPTAPAVNRASTRASRGRFRSCPRVRRVPGRMPLAPAVGAATMRPIAAFHSTTAIEAATAVQKPRPEADPSRL